MVNRTRACPCDMSMLNRSLNFIVSSDFGLGVLGDLRSHSHGLNPDESGVDTIWATREGDIKRPTEHSVGLRRDGRLPVDHGDMRPRSASRTGKIALVDGR